MKHILTTCMAMVTWTWMLLLLLTSMAEARYASINVNLAMTVSEDSHHLSEDMVRICARETDISMDELHKFQQHDLKNSTTPTATATTATATTSPATQCFAHCIYEQLGLMRDGVFVERDVIRALADVADPKSFIMYQACHGLSGANKCETAYKIYRCRQELGMHGKGMLPETTTTMAATTAAVPTGEAASKHAAAHGPVLGF